MDNRQIDERKKQIKEKRIRRVQILRDLISCMLVCILGLIPILSAEGYKHYETKNVSATVSENVEQEKNTVETEDAEVSQEDVSDEKEAPEEDVVIEEDVFDEHTRGAALLDEVNLYKEAAEDAYVTAIIQYGEQVTLLEEQDGWYYVQCGKLNGYVKKTDVVRFNNAKKQVALTFDDGPSSATTPIILDALEKYRCRATFFTVGENISDSTGDILNREISLGCEIGNHTYSHVNLKILETKKAIKKEINKTNKLLKEYIGKKAGLVRTPYGATSKKVLSAVGSPNIYWSIDTEDWKYKDTERLIKYVRKHAQNGSIILMHDIHESTANAIASICANLREDGFEAVTVSELAAINGTKLESGETYFGFESTEEEENE